MLLDKLKRVIFLLDSLLLTFLAHFKKNASALMSVRLSPNFLFTSDPGRMDVKPLEIRLSAQTKCAHRAFSSHAKISNF